MKTMIKCLIVCSLALLTACNPLKNDNINTICKDSPELCSDLHKIGDCRFKRTTVIRARYYDKTAPSEARKRDLLTELDEYESCLELTLFMQFTRNKQRKKLRLENYLQAQKLIQSHLAESKGTKDPMLAYYLWTRYQDMQARDVFLSAATKDNVKDPRLLLKLARVYSKDNPQQSLNLFYKALRTSPSLDQVSADTFVMIMTIFYQHRRFEEAYVWALLAEKQDENDEYPIDLELILKKGNAYGKRLITNEGQLRDNAQHFYYQLDDGTFKAKAPLL